jgi:hypothetical protein
VSRVTAASTAAIWIAEGRKSERRYEIRANSAAPMANRVPNASIAGRDSHGSRLRRGNIRCTTAMGITTLHTTW